MKGNNLLISNFDRKILHVLRFVSGVRIVERCDYTAIEGGYDETVIVEGDRERLRAAVTRALDYAREFDLTVQVNNTHVREDIENGVLDVRRLLIVDSILRTIVDGRDYRARVARNKNTSEALQKLVENLLDALEQNDDCSGLDCSECPLDLKETEEDPRYDRHTCGWLLLKSAASNILRK